MFFAISELEQPLWTNAKHRFALPPEYRIEKMSEIARLEWQRPVKALAIALKGKDYILGDGFSFADILLAHTLIWANASKFPLGSPILEDYLKRVSSRPAWIRVKALR